MSMRLNQFLANSGVASRRKADDLIKSGRVTINGITARVGQQLNPDEDKVFVDGKAVTQRPLFYFKYYKPVGVMSSLSDPHYKNTLAKLPIKEKFFPVGRLDVESEGLVVLTNDGVWAQKLIHPSKNQTKEYEVMIDTSKAKKNWLTEIRRGVLIDGKFVKPKSIKLVSSGMLNIVLSEGIKREIRRLAEKVGLKVLKLKRIRIGKILLGDLKVGELKLLTSDEILDTFEPIHFVSGSPIL